MELTKELRTVTLQQILFLCFRCSTAQMSEASDQVLHPINPTLVRDVEVRMERGETVARVLQDGSLLYREPITDIEFE